jgi:hypothetical protein
MVIISPVVKAKTCPKVKSNIVGPKLLTRLNASPELQYLVQRQPFLYLETP